MQYQSIQRKSFFVSDYGAYPDDNLDDTNEIQLAINDAIKYGLITEICYIINNFNRQCNSRV